MYSNGCHQNNTEDCETVQYIVSSLWWAGSRSGDLSTTPTAVSRYCCYRDIGVGYRHSNYNVSLESKHKIILIIIILRIHVTSNVI